MRPNLYPQPPRRLRVADLPLVLDKCHRLIETFRCQDFVAAKPDEVEARKTLATVTNPETLCKRLHIAVDGHEDRVIGERS